MKTIPTQSENPKGLHQRYIVSKANGDTMNPNAEYFILRVDPYGSDPKHIAACRKAVIAYANEIKDHLPELSKDLIERYSNDLPPSEEKKALSNEVKDIIDCILKFDTTGLSSNAVANYFEVIQRDLKKEIKPSTEGEHRQYNHKCINCGIIFKNDLVYKSSRIRLCPECNVK